MKHERHRRILELIADERIETQEQLARRVGQVYMPVTQATMSRDIRELHLQKVLDAQTGTTYYAAPANGEAFSARLSSIFRDCVVGCSCAQNLVVVKTLPGMANAAGAAIDAANNKEIVGTLAGDDTVFVAMKTAQAAKLYADDIEGSL